MTTFDIDDDIRRDESDELHGQAGGWFDPSWRTGQSRDLLGYRQFLPVEAPPEHPQVRAAIAQLISDYAPTRLDHFTVDWVAPDYAIIIGRVPSKIGQLVTLDVYIDDAPDSGPLA